MTAKFMDSFDHYSNPSQKWYNSYHASIVTGAGRFGTNACQLQSDGYLTYYQPDLTLGWTNSYMNTQEWVVGFALKRTIAETKQLINFCLYPDISTTQIAVGVDAYGAIYVTSGSTTVLTTSLKMSLDDWYYVEAKVKTDVWPGETYDIHVNGNVWGSAISPITPQSTPIYEDPPAYYINSIIISGCGTPYIDDVYILAVNANDPLGTTHNNTFWGDTRIEVMHPEADGFYQDWTPSSGSEGWRMVNGIYDQYTDNVYTYPTYSRETFVMDSLIALPGTVNAVQQSILLKQSNWLEPLIYTSGSPYYLTSGSYRVAFGVNTSPVYGNAIWQVDPSTLLGWDDVNLPAAQFGFMSTTTSGSL